MDAAVPFRRPGRRPQIDLERIVAAGAAIGLRQLSMKAVADALGVSPQALYRHVRDREALEVLVGEHLTASFELPDDVGQPWTEYLVELGHRLREVLTPHPGLGTYLRRLGPASAGTLRIIDRCDQVLVSRGLLPIDALFAGGTVANFAISYVEMEATLDAGAPTESRERFARAVEVVGPERLPVLVQAIGEYRAAGVETYFDWSLRALVRGIAAQLADGIHPVPDSKVSSNMRRQRDGQRDER
jgi:AcrR family transcriptional regulator